MTYSLGIDVGTTFTAAAVWRDGRAETVQLGDHAYTVPSVVFLRDDGEVLVGDPANRRAVTEPGRVAREFKRRIGDQVPLLLGGQPVTPQALTGHMLRWVVARVTEREGSPPANVTLTYPANWSGYRRELVVQAATAAGVPSVGLLTEPVAAAIYYATQGRLEHNDTVGVYDLGGGTFDATIVRRVRNGFELVGQPSGDEQLGGIDFDQAVMDHVIGALGDGWEGLDLTDPAVLRAVAQLRAHVVVAKEALSEDVETSIPVILPGMHREVRLTRAELEEMVRQPLLRTISTFRDTAESAGVQPRSLRAMLLVGGSSRIPLVAELIASELGVPVAVDTHPKFAVCLGAAIDASARLTGSADLAATTAIFAPPLPGPSRAGRGGPEVGTGAAGDEKLLDGEGAAPGGKVGAGVSGVERGSGGVEAADLLSGAAGDDASGEQTTGFGAAEKVIGGVWDPEADQVWGTPGPQGEPEPERVRGTAGPEGEPEAGRSGGAERGRADGRQNAASAGWGRWVLLGGAGVLIAVVAVVAAVVLSPGDEDGGGGLAGGATSTTRGEPQTSTTTTLPTPRIPRRWTSIADAPKPLEAVAATAHQGKIWVAGGSSPARGRPDMADVQVYDPARDSWSAGPRLPGPVSHAALVSNGESLYLIGGQTPRVVATVLRLDDPDGEWVKDKPLPEPRTAGAGAWDGERIVYGGGGLAHDNKTNADEIYALEDGKWKQIGTLQKARNHLAAASDGAGTVWFMAGSVSGNPSKTGAVDVVVGDRVDPAPGGVDTLRAPAGFWLPGIGPCVVGGLDLDERSVRKASCLDKTQSAEFPGLRTARAALGAAVIQGKAVYTVGGFGSGFVGSDFAEALEFASR